MIIIICGPVASGKTTVAKELKKRLIEQGCEFTILHSDEFKRNTYDKMYNKIKDLDDDWILDGTLYSKEIRDKFRLLDDTYIIYLKTELEDCLKRNRERENQLDEKVVYIMWNKFEVPNYDLRIDTSILSIEESVKTILNFIESKS